MLSGPMANGLEGGALHVPASTFLGVRGDAIYTTEVPQWAFRSSAAAAIAWPAF